MQKNITVHGARSPAPMGTTVLTRADHRELLPFAAASRRAGDVADRLAEKLETAAVVEASEVPPTLVTMNTELDVLDEDSGHTSRITLVYPRDADIVAGRVSVLTPVGVALLGLSQGTSTRVRVPSGEERNLTVVRVRMQPEARGRAAAGVG
jgi:regulator of nucleoside diphosphate kinase